MTAVSARPLRRRMTEIERLRIESHVFWFEHVAYFLCFALFLSLYSESPTTLHSHTIDLKFRFKFGLSTLVLNHLLTCFWVNPRLSMEDVVERRKWEVLKSCTFWWERYVITYIIGYLYLVKEANLDPMMEQLVGGVVAVYFASNFAYLLCYLGSVNKPKDSDRVN